MDTCRICGVMTTSGSVCGSCAAEYGPGDGEDGLADRVEALEADLHALTVAMVAREARLHALEEVRFPTEGVEEVPRGWAGAGEIWRTGTIALDHRELEGLDLSAFKALLREKFHLLGDALVTAFLKERAEHKVTFRGAPIIWDEPGG